MTKRLSKKLRRFALACLLSGGLIGAISLLGNTASAVETFTVEDATHEYDEYDYVCGWTDESWEASDTCNYDPIVGEKEPADAKQVTTEQAAPEQVTAEQVTAFEPVAVEPIADELVSDDRQIEAAIVVASSFDLDPVGTAIWTPTFRRTASNFEVTLAATAAAACAKVGVSLEQLAEPFAMVGPQECNSLDEVIQLQEFWQLTNRAKVEAELTKVESRVTPISPQSNESELDETESAIMDEATTAVESIAQHQAPATAADTVASVANYDDAPFPIVGFVPIVDFDSILDTNDAWAPRLASARASKTIKSVEATETVVDWDHLEDELFSATEAADELLDDKKVEIESPATAPEPSLHTFDRSVMTEDSAPMAKLNEMGDSLARFVGTSPVIFTMEEVYMPYDFAARDMQVSNLFPLSRRPFCVRSRMDLPELLEARSPSGASDVIVQDELDQVASKDAEPYFANSEANDRLLEDLVWHAKSTISQYDGIRDSLRPNHIGQHLAAFVVSGNEMTRRFVQRLAKAWPAAAPQPLSSAGAELLARASAQTDEVVAATELNATQQNTTQPTAQVAEAPSDGATSTLR